MIGREYDFVIMEITREDAYLREIVSRYPKSHYYDVSLHHSLGRWSIELSLETFETVSEREYHGKFFEDHVKEPRVFAVTSNKREVGWIEVGYDQWNNRMRVWELLVEEEFRRKGVGTLLITHAVKIARERGARMVVLETQSNNVKAIDFYLGFGFKLIGLDIAAYSNEDIDRKEIRLELGLKLQ